MAKSLEERAREFITEERGKIAVDWQTLVYLKDISIRNSDRRIFEKIFDRLLSYLKEKGVLVHEDTPGSYFAAGANVHLHPSLSGGMVNFSFVNEEDAKEYYRNFFKNVSYSVVLHQTIGVVERKK
ncbi:MAG: hypothetical protein Q8N99_07670 [Nanoarchaeota archaeon]|nr:hypothetical protein [Nanoarchaeota archaeon]